MYPKEINPITISLFKNNILPIVVYALEISDKPNWKHTVHKHEDMCEIILIAEGRGYYIVDNAKYLAKKGDLLVYNRGVLHDERSDPDAPLKTYCLGINNIYINGLNEMQIIPSHVCPVICTKDKFSRLQGCFSTILDEFNSKDKCYEQVCQNLVSVIIILINRIIENVHKELNDNEKVTLALKVKEYIDKNYMKDIKLETIAKDFHFSTYYLSHVFKKEIHFSPIDYIIQRRIGEAQRLLLSTNKSIKEAAVAVGYDDVNYFSSLFKKITSFSPGGFRKSFKEI